ncbi:MAG TPA: helix-turn-helix domain-containing protein [Aequorivita sp.]|nr:helix-turn-helix domain-containing protein [Aequorivita sp.]
MPQIINITPHVSLEPYVQNYSLLQLNTDQFNFVWPVCAKPETNMVFSLTDTPIGLAYDFKTSFRKISERILIIGVSTRFNGVWKLNGSYVIFRILFTANGFHSLFALSLKDFTNQMVDAKSVFGNQIAHLDQQLRRANNINEMAMCADAFLKGFVLPKKDNTLKEGFTAVYNTILQSNCAVPIEEYATMANMSMRNFERKFREQVGTSPKLFCRTLRFNRALKLKLRAPGKCWTNIALECDYYDQMHMIRDFKKFGGMSPTKLFLKINSPFCIENVNRVL